MSPLCSREHTESFINGLLRKGSKGSKKQACPTVSLFVSPHRLVIFRPVSNLFNDDFGSGRSKGKTHTRGRGNSYIEKFSYVKFLKRKQWVHGNARTLKLTIVCLPLLIGMTGVCRKLDRYLISYNPQSLFYLTTADQLQSSMMHDLFLLVFFLWQKRLPQHCAMPLLYSNIRTRQAHYLVDCVFALVLTKRGENSSSPLC